MSKAFRALEPVLLQGNINGIRICRFHGPNDLLVFIDGDVKVLDDRARVEAPVTLSLRLDAAMQRLQPRASAVLDDEAVEVAIDLEEDRKSVV